jgi:hypothetical protein
MNKYKFSLPSYTKIILVLLLTYTFPVFGKIIKFSNSPRLSIELNTIYNDNIFLFSDAYINDFKNQINAYRFPFSTYDDLITNINLSLRIPYSRTSNISLYYKQYLYALNSEKSYQIVSTTINQRISKPVNLKASYLYLPRYLIRYYRDPLGSSTKYIGCTFTEHLFTIGFDYSIKNVKLSPFVRYEIDNYKKNFNFYNSKAIRFGADVNWTISKIMAINLRFESKQNKAKGPIPDISYNDNNGSVQFETRIPNYEKLGLNLGADYSKRSFTTLNSATIDPYHKDRIDGKFSFLGSLIYRFSNKLQVILDYEHEIRKVSSTSLIYIEDIKDYTNRRLSLGFKINSIRIIEGE